MPITREMLEERIANLRPTSAVEKAKPTDATSLNDAIRKRRVQMRLDEDLQEENDASTSLPKPKLVPAPVPKPTPQPALSVAPQPAPVPRSLVRALVKKFENVLHPYSKVGGNLAGNKAINRPVVDAPKLKPTSAKSATDVTEKEESKLIKPKPILRPSLSKQLQDELKAKVAARAEQQKLAQEAKLRRKQIEDDAILAAKLQTEEETKVASKLPSPAKNQFDKAAANTVARDNYHRHLAEIFKALRPQVNKSFMQPHEQFMQEAKKLAQPKTASNEHPLNQFAMLMYIETHSLQLTATMNGFVLQQVSHAMFLGISANQNQLHVQMAAASFASETSYDGKNLRNHSMFANAQASQSFHPKPNMGGSSKLLDDMQNEMPARSGIKAR